MSIFDEFISRVRAIPRGKVATYGQIAALAGHPRSARMVGWALHNLSEKNLEHVPWHRVINRQGRISTTCLDHTAEQQAWLLKKEGIRVELNDGNYFVDLKKYLWRPLLPTSLGKGVKK
jgi:methylated-DNA-protein-cysteine methyltransferase related protein